MSSDDISSSMPGTYESKDLVLSRLADTIFNALDPLIPLDSTCAFIDFPYYSNVGDSAIWLAERKYLRRRGAQIVYACDHFTYSRETMAASLRKDSVILCHGGGNFGDLWPILQKFREQVIADFPNHRIIVFPQSINFQKLDNLKAAKEAFKRNDQLTFVLRDKYSFDFAANEFKSQNILCPDMSFLLGPIKPVDKKHVPLPVVCLLRTDHETRAEPISLPEKSGIVTDWLEESASFERLSRHLTGHYVPTKHLWQSFFIDKLAVYELLAGARLNRGLRILGKGKVVITDRLHGLILSLLLGIPHVVLEDKFGKLKASYQAWIDGTDLTHWADNVEQALLIAERINNT